MPKKIKKVAILYRVIQGWRVPIFERLNNSEDLEICVFHGKSFESTKVINYDGEKKFNSKCLPTIKLNLPTRNGRAIMPLNLTLFWELIKYRPDVILSEGASNFLNNIFAFIYKVIFRKKMIWWSLGEIKNRKKSLLRKIMDKPIHFLETRMDAILVYSSYGKQYFLNLGIPEKKIFVAVNVIDTDMKKKEIRKLNPEKLYQEKHQISKFNILFVGALTKEKKLDILLQAFKKLESIASDVHLTIVGDGPYMHSYTEMAKELAINNINFEGKIIDKVSEYFLSSDIFVLPGLGGLAVSDSLVHGLPLIASIADGCEKDLLGTGAGIIEETLTADILFDHLHACYSNPDKIKEMKKEAYNVINNKYNINTYMNNVEDSIAFSINN